MGTDVMGTDLTGTDAARGAEAGRGTPAGRDAMRSRTTMLAEGWTDRALAEAVRGGGLHRVRRGWYADPSWESLRPEERHRALIRAVDQDTGGTAVFSHVSAAVLHRVPLYRAGRWLDRAHMTTDAPRRISSAPDVFRHRLPLPAGDVTEIDGIRCTSLARTVFDVIRMLPDEGAVTAADAGERARVLGEAETWAGAEWDADAAERWRGELAQRIDDAPGARGIRRARWVAPFGDGRAQLPGESVSRLQLHRLGFAPPRLQVEIAGPRGRRYFTDFAFDDFRTFGEFDGEGKYRDERMRAGRAVADVLLAEKRREDWIRGVTGWGLVRWGWEHCTTPGALARRLAAFGIRPR